MNRVALFILLTLLVSSCSKNDQELPPGLRAGGFKLEDPIKHQQVLTSMAALAIPYEISNDGMVVYMQKDRAKVRGLIRKSQYGDRLKANITESIAAPEDRYFELLTQALEANRIPYRVDDHRGLRQVFYDQTYGPEVDVIIQQVGFERFKELKSSFQ